MLNHPLQRHEPFDLKGIAIPYIKDEPVFEVQQAELDPWKQFDVERDIETRLRRSGSGNAAAKLPRLFIEFLDRFVARRGGGIVRLIRVVSRRALTFDLVLVRHFPLHLGSQEGRKVRVLFERSKGMVSAIKSSTNSSDFIEGLDR